MHARSLRSAPTVVAAAGLIAVGVLAATSAAGGRVAAQTGAGGLDRERLATTLLAHRHDRFATQAYSRALHVAAGGSTTPGRGIGGDEEGATGTPRSKAAAATLPRAGLRNVRVNDPREDRHQVDQTTQSETTLAVAGRHVAVGFNDSQQALFGLTDGFDFSGYAYSTNGGRSFRDGGTLPNPVSFVNFGDPWLASDRAGRMYYATLTYGGDVGNLEVAVSRSDDGGRTWSEPTLVSPNDDSLFYLADKDALTVGRDPRVASQDNLYATWDDAVFDPSGDFRNGLPVSVSTDHGRTWSLHYADEIVSDPNSCSFTGYIGAQPMVDGSNGTLYVAAEKGTVDDPDCNGGDVHLSEVLFRSVDAGRTFDQGHTIATITPATPDGALRLGPGRLVRTAEFPALAMRGSTMWAAWNDGGTGRSHIRLATSTDAGATWSTRLVTSGDSDELQPAMSVDGSGLHLAYYRRNGDDTLDTVLADSTDGGRHFAAKAVTTKPFPGVITVPQFDPQVAFGYMGDYIANVSSGGHVYLAWGDNRDRVTDFMHPAGRHDPDVFFARR
jgi:hypothetical protein